MGFSDLGTDIFLDEADAEADAEPLITIDEAVKDLSLSEAFRAQLSKRFGREVTEEELMEAVGRARKRLEDAADAADEPIDRSHWRHGGSGGGSAWRRDFD